MKEVGEAMHVSLRETGEGGIANTPWTREFAAQLLMWLRGGDRRKNERRECV